MEKTDLTCLYNRCDICIDETCKGKRNCKCKTCKQLHECHKLLHATVRITNKCTQKCVHCCFSSSPESNIMMPVEMASDIAKFFKSNQVVAVNIVGGEFYCNPDWYEIIDLLAESTLKVRLVTNCDWAVSENAKEKLIKLVSKYPNINFSLSKDKWHTNAHVDEAVAFLDLINAKYNVATEKETTDDSIVPVGRGELSYGYKNMYSMFNCYCLNPENQYTFLIDEKGYIYRCAFGTWKYADVTEYIDGGFRARFKDYNQKVLKIFLPNCLKCRQSAERWNKTDAADFEQIVIETV